MFSFLRAKKDTALKNSSKAVHIIHMMGRKFFMYVCSYVFIFYARKILIFFNIIINEL